MSPRTSDFKGIAQNAPNVPLSISDRKEIVHNVTWLLAWVPLSISDMKGIAMVILNISVTKEIAQDVTWCPLAILTKTHSPEYHQGAPCISDTKEIA